VNAQLDHVFICCSPGAHEADALRALGLKEGSSNTHPGQGTACRRFFFSNAYLELLWVCDETEARSADVAPTRLWKRWAGRNRGICPYALVLRPGTGAEGPPPFAWLSYRPRYLPDGLSIDVALETPLEGPEFFYLGFLRAAGAASHQPTTHELPCGKLTGVTVYRPPAGHSTIAAALETAGIATFRDADEYLLELRFDDAIRGTSDVRPTLPLVLKW
jgi:Glyoxalase-like domain